MATGMPELGSRISLISRSDIRYEGKLYTVDPQECTISLSSVRSLGTEDRNVEKPVPAQSLIYDYILFRASDIKDIKVLSPNMPDDPAIVQMATSSTMNAYQRPFGSFPQSYMPQLAPGGPLQGWLSGQQSGAFPPQAAFSQTQFANMGSASSTGNQAKNQSEWKDKVNDFQNKQPIPPFHYLPQDGAFLEMEDANIDKTPVMTPTYNQMRHGPMDIFPKASFSTSTNNESSVTTGEKTFTSVFDMLDEQKVSSMQKTNDENRQLLQATGSSSEKVKDQNVADPKTSLKTLFGSSGRGMVLRADRFGVQGKGYSALGTPKDLSEMDPETARSTQCNVFEGREKDRKFADGRKRKEKSGQEMNLPGPSNEFESRRYRGMGGNFRGQNNFTGGGVGGDWSRPSRNWEQGYSGWSGGGNNFLSRQPRWHNNQEWHRQDGRNTQGARFRGQYNHYNHQNRFPSFLPQFQNVGKTQLKFDREYDFEEANTHFEELKAQISKMKIGGSKPEEAKKESSSGQEEEEKESTTEAKAYDKTKSFFDAISCEAEKKNNPNDARVGKVSERKLNTETFGVPVAPRTYVGGYGHPVGMPPHRFARGMTRDMGRSMSEGRGAFRNYIPSHYPPRKNFGNANRKIS